MSRPPDNLGGFVRLYDIPWIVRVSTPVFLKFGLRNAPDVYPSGSHLDAVAVPLARERVRRARLGLDLLERYQPNAVMSAIGASDLALRNHGPSRNTGMPLLGNEGESINADVRSFDSAVLVVDDEDAC
jgi:hypothetical protein